MLDNALKFSGGKIEVDTNKQHGKINIIFTDKGQGINEEDLKYIFEPFYRADPSRSRKTGGFGLGLSICKKIMDAHEGDIRIESTPGSGTIVTIKIPQS